MAENWAQPICPPREENDGMPLAFMLKIEADDVANVLAEDVAR